MSTNSEKREDGSPSLRISSAVHDLLGSPSTHRGTELIASAGESLDASFTKPSALHWVSQLPINSDDSDEPRWSDSVSNANVTGLVRRYSGRRATGTEVKSDALAGMRVTHKDNIGISGYPISVGNPALSEQRAELTSPLLTCLESAGASIVGANHMAEFALSPTGHNHWLGDGVNPLNNAYLSGGSSSGSAISVALGSSDLSLGTDTGGSVRLPATFCGLTGYKPTNGLFSSEGLVPLSETLDTIGLIAASPLRIRTAVETLFADSSVVDKGSRSRLDSPAGGSESEMSHLSLSAVEHVSDPVVSEAFRKALAALEVVGTANSDSDRSCDHKGEFHDPDINTRAVTVVSVEAARNVGRIINWNWNLLGDQVLSRVIRGTAISALEYADAIAVRSALRDQFLATAMKSARFLLTPTSPILAPSAPSDDNASPDQVRSEYMRASAYTRSVNYLGLPAVTIPLRPTDGRVSPGLQIIGRPYDDRALIDCAVAVADAVA